MVVLSSLRGNISPIRSPESTTTKPRFLARSAPVVTSGLRPSPAPVVGFDILAGNPRSLVDRLATSANASVYCAGPVTIAAFQRRPPAASVVAAADGRSRAHRWVSVGIAIALFAGSPTALAAPAKPLPSVEDEPPQPEEPKEDPMLTRAMAAYERGQENYKLAQYEAALADFQEASSLYASPDFQYNIGLCYEKLGRYDQAVLAYVTYLKVKPDADDRVSVEATIKRLQEIIKQQKEAPTTTPTPQPEGPKDTPPERDTSKPLIISGAV